MLTLNAGLTAEIFLLNINRSHLCRKILCFDCDS